MRRLRFLGTSLAAAISFALASCHGTDAQYTVGGTVTGTTGAVVLRLNGANDLSQSGDGNFTFTHKLLTNDLFNVQIADPNDRCTVQNGTGVMEQKNITDVSITCAPQTDEFVVRSAVLNGSNEVPTVATSMTGVGGIVVDPKDPTNITIDGGFTLSGLTTQAITQVNILLSPSGALVQPMILAADGATAVMPAGATLTPTTYSALLSGLLYFSVATLANPNGEIRGTIELQGGVAAGLAALDKLQVVPPTTSTALGGGILIADRATRNILITYIAHTVVSPTGAEIRSSAGSGSLVLPFANLQNNYDSSGTNLASPAAALTLSTQNLADFDASLLFFNVQSSNNLCAPAVDCSAGEIRGNIVVIQ